MARSDFIVFVLSLVVAVVFSSASVSNAAERIPPLFQDYAIPIERISALAPADIERNYRLPNNTEPLHYDIELNTNVHRGEYEFSGKVTILIQVLQDTRTIVLHARQLTISAASIQMESGGSSYTLNPSYDSEVEFLSLTPQDAILSFQTGQKWLLTIQYNGLLRKDNGGFYMSTYTDEQNNTRYLATTQFESTDARHGFPCFDEPAKRATFTIAINHDPSYHAISNMPVDTSKSTAGHTVFQTTVNMPTYLIAFIVSDFKFSEGRLNSLTQRVYSRSGSENDQEWALVSGLLLIQRLSDYYGINFTMPKLDQVAVPDFAAGAMENWGLVTYREEYMLYNKDKSTVNTQTGIASTIAHEYTHQWFGNLVAIKWWTYLWLKEGFATLFSYEATNEAYPEWGVYQLFHISEYNRGLNNDAGATSRPMTHYIQKPREISQLYDAISYAKGGSVLSMWQHALTNAVFRQGLHNYLEHNKFTGADENDLFKGIQDAAKELNFPIPATIEDMMSSWTRQEGYPLLTVVRNYEDGSFTIRQERFYNNASLSGDSMWYIPINAAVQSNPDFRDTKATHFMLKSKEVKVTDVKPSKDDWLILNKQSTGYYRINYDEQNWRLIIKGLINKPHKIHPRNRAQLMHDAYRFSVSNRLNHSFLMEILMYLPKEDQYAPWSTANDILTTLNRLLRGDAEYQNFKKYVELLVTDIYEKLGVNDISGEQHFQKYTRSIAINLACMVGIESCLKETNDKLIGLVEKQIEIEPNLVSQIYCSGLKQSADKEFNFIYNELMESDDQARRRLIISSLGCAQKEEHIKKFIESSIDMNNKLRTQERTTLLNSAYARGEVGLLACIEFLKQNWQKYGNLTGGFGGNKPLDTDIRGMSSYVVNEKQEKALQELVDMVKSSEYVDKSLEQSVHSNINTNFAWLKDNRSGIMGWLFNYYKNPQDSGSATARASLIGITVIVFLTRLL